MLVVIPLLFNYILCIMALVKSLVQKLNGRAAGRWFAVDVPDYLAVAQLIDGEQIIIYLGAVQSYFSTLLSL
jgi:hypothetical protein